MQPALARDRSVFGALPCNDWERAAVESRLGAAIVGSDHTVRSKRNKLVTDTRAGEVIVVSDTFEHSDRLRSYERVANVARRIGPTPILAGDSVAATK